MLCLISGANWNNGSNAGAWASNWNNYRTNSNSNVGFRADSISPETQQCETGNEGDGFLPWAKSLYAPLFSNSGDHQRGHLL
tara:strand:+ start:236 stop:481 length:246 start_codon:yes stop_codon:yes gene_type:complete